MAVHKRYDRNVLGRGLDDIGNGRGLDALIDTGEVRTQGSSNLCEIPLEQIHPNPNQPRREFDEDALQELAASIREVGIIQPITLRQTEDGQYQIIAGERRWRASQIAGLAAVPAYIRTVQDENVMEMALVENIQREDLNAIEIALAYEHLSETTGMTQEKISERVGKSRAAVTNYMRLLQFSVGERRVDVCQRVAGMHHFALFDIHFNQSSGQLARHSHAGAFDLSLHRFVGRLDEQQSGYAQRCHHEPENCHASHD